MKQTTIIHLPDNVDAQAALRAISEYFEAEWEPRVSELRDGKLLIMEPQRARLNKYMIARRIKPWPAIFQRLEFSVALGSTSHETRLLASLHKPFVHSLPIATVFYLGALLVIFGHETSPIASATIIALLLLLHVALFYAWICSLNGRIRRQVKKVISVV
jgi:hypothetical protein